jgi:hypothetical protein
MRQVFPLGATCSVLVLVKQVPQRDVIAATVWRDSERDGRQPGGSLPARCHSEVLQSVLQKALRCCVEPMRRLYSRIYFNQIPFEPGR